MTDYTRCKSFGHAWDDAPAPPGSRPAPDRNHGRLHFRCINCYMIKRVTVHLYTGQTRNYYIRPGDWSDVKQSKGDWKMQYTLAVTRRLASKPKRKGKKK